MDSARFASGLNIEPVVASHSALKKAIADLYRNMQVPGPSLTVEVGQHPSQEGALPVHFQMDPLPMPAHATSRPAEFPRDPFFDGPTAPTQPMSVDPFGFFAPPPTLPAPGPTPPQALNPMDLVHSRTLNETVSRLESYQTRTLVLGLIRLFQRRGIIGQDELQRLLMNLLESGELKDNDRVG
jgi:hypothetical protein